MRSFRISPSWVAPVAECCVLGPSFCFGAVVQLWCGEILVACCAERAKGSPKTHTPPPPLGYPVSFAHGVTRGRAVAPRPPLWGAAVSAARLWLFAVSPQPPRWRLSMKCLREAWWGEASGRAAVSGQSPPVRSAQPGRALSPRAPQSPAIPLSITCPATMVRRNFMHLVLVWEMGVYCGIVE